MLHCKKKPLEVGLLPISAIRLPMRCEEHSENVYRLTLCTEKLSFETLVEEVQSVVLETDESESEKEEPHA